MIERPRIVRVAVRDGFVPRGTRARVDIETTGWGWLWVGRDRQFVRGSAITAWWVHADEPHDIVLWHPFGRDRQRLVVPATHDLAQAARKLAPPEATVPPPVTALSRPLVQLAPPTLRMPRPPTTLSALR